jgi:hypothetical protein
VGGRELLEKKIQNEKIQSSWKTCLVCVFGIYVVLDGIAALLVEVLGSDLD